MDDARYASLMQKAIRLVTVAYVIDPDDQTGKFRPAVGDLRADECPDLLVALSMLAVAIARAAEANGCAKSAHELIQQVALTVSPTTG